MNTKSITTALQNERSTRTTRTHYRSKIQITYDILRAISEKSGGISRSKIMYKSLLNSGRLNSYLAMLITNNLIHYDEKTKIYTVGEKGFQFIKNYEELSELIPNMNSALC